MTSLIRRLFATDTTEQRREERGPADAAERLEAYARAVLEAGRAPARCGRPQPSPRSLRFNGSVGR